MPKDAYELSPELSRWLHRSGARSTAKYGGARQKREGNGDDPGIPSARPVAGRPTA